MLIRLYTILLYLLLPLLILRLYLKAFKSNPSGMNAKPRVLERLAIYSNIKPAQSSPLWIHTVSVGEFMAVKPLLVQLMQKQPNIPLLISCTTLTGSKQIQLFLRDFQQNIQHVYLPWDTPIFMKKFYSYFKPRAGILFETEIWPNLLLQAQKTSIPMFLFNARMSEKSASGYLRFAKTTKDIVNLFQMAAVQNEQDAKRFLQLGLNDDRIKVCGSIKFDLSIDEDDLQQHPLNTLKQKAWKNKNVILFSSSHSGEDEIILQAYKHLRDKFTHTKLIIVPRHPERFTSVKNLAQTMGKEYLVQLKSQLSVDTMADFDILIGDSMGEMLAYYQISDIVVIGGSFINQGGHNLLEAAALKKPIIVGPYMFNFAAISQMFLAHKALIQCHEASVEELQQHLEQFISQAELAEQYAQNAHFLMQKNKGTVQRFIDILNEHQIILKTSVGSISRCIFNSSDKAS